MIGCDWVYTRGREARINVVNVVFDYANVDGIRRPGALGKIGDHGGVDGQQEGINTTAKVGRNAELILS